MLIHRPSQRPLNTVDLSHTIKLVTAQIEKNQHLRIELVGNGRYVHFIDFQRGDVVIATCTQRRHNSRVHVVAALIGGGGESGACGSGQHPRRRGLAVRSRHQRDRAACVDPAHDHRINRCGNHPADHPARATARFLRGPRSCVGKSKSGPTLGVELGLRSIAGHARDPSFQGVTDTIRAGAKYLVSALTEGMQRAHGAFPYARTSGIRVFGHCPRIRGCRTHATSVREHCESFSGSLVLPGVRVTAGRARFIAARFSAARRRWPLRPNA